MRASTPAERYTGTAIALHWAIAALILTNFPIGFFNEPIENELGVSTMWMHKSIGLTVLALSVVRLAWRLTHRPPPLPETVIGWRVGTSRAVHRLFYALIILVPLTGWLRTSAGTYPLTWFELVDIPKFHVVRGSFEARLASSAHEVLAWTMLMLVALHVAAALHHHFVLRDQILRRMLPLRERQSQSDEGGKRSTGWPLGRGGRLRRLAFLLLGFASLAAGAAGIVLPLVPTIPFVLLAAFCFANSSPRLERWLVEHRRFGPHIRSWRTSRSISRSGKRAAWLAFAASALVGLLALPLPWGALPAVAAVIGSLWIARLPSSGEVSRRTDP